MVRRGRVTAAVVAGTIMVLGGSGAGAAALVLGHGAGALSLQAPALAVKEQNVNAAGRIRVALPAGGVGVNGSVDVGNFPKSVNVGNLPLNSAGRLQTQNGTGAWLQGSGAASNVGSSPVTVVSISGPGALKGMMLSIQNVAANAINNVKVIIVADGSTVFARSWFAFVCCWPSTPELGSTTPNATATSYASGNPSHNASMWFYPPGGIHFRHSMQIEVQQPAHQGGQVDSVIAQYTTG